MDLSQKEYKKLKSAYDYFNKHLFGNELPDCMITIRGRWENHGGSFLNNRFKGRGNTSLKMSEISLNPVSFHKKGDMQILATLAHEMVHRTLGENLEGGSPQDFSKV